MEKKSIIIIIIALILVIIGAIAFTTFSNSSQITVGDATFEIPSGFHEGTLNSAGDVNITNGYDSVFIKVHNHSNITKAIKDYKKYKKENNQSVKVSTLNIDNIEVYKSTVTNESHTVHYWFVYKDKVYSIYTWGSENIDDIATDLIKSLN